MRRIVTIIASFVLCASFVGCSEETTSNGATSSNTQTTSQTVSSKSDIISSSASDSTSESDNESKNDSQPAVDTKPIQERDIVSKEVETNNKGQYANRYTTPIIANPKTVTDCFNKIKSKTQTIHYRIKQESQMNVKTGSYSLAEKQGADVINIETTQDLYFFTNAGSLTISFGNEKSLENKNEILKSLIEPELAEYIIKSTDKLSSNNTSVYLNNKSIKADYQFDKKDNKYILSITYTPMNEAFGELAPAVSNGTDIYDGYIVHDFPTPLSAFFTSKEPTDLESIKSRKSLFDKAIQGSTASNGPTRQTNTVIEYMDLTDDGSQNISIVSNSDFTDEEKSAYNAHGDYMNLNCKLGTYIDSQKGKCYYGKVQISFTKKNPKEDSKTILNQALNTLFPGVKINQNGAGEITIEGVKVNFQYKDEVNGNITRRTITYGNGNYNYPAREIVSW